jgi:hypothetical protein
VLPGACGADALVASDGECHPLDKLSNERMVLVSSRTIVASSLELMSLKTTPADSTPPRPDRTSCAMLPQHSHPSIGFAFAKRAGSGQTGLRVAEALFVGQLVAQAAVVPTRQCSWSSERLMAVSARLVARIRLSN